MKTTITTIRHKLRRAVQNDPKIMSAFDRAVYETLLNRQEEMEARLKKAPGTFQALFSNRKIEEIGPNVKGPKND